MLRFTYFSCLVVSYVAVQCKLASLLFNWSGS